MASGQTRWGEIPVPGRRGRIGAPAAAVQRFLGLTALGSALVMAFAFLKSGSAGGVSIHFADLLLLAAMLCAAVGHG